MAVCVVGVCVTGTLRIKKKDIEERLIHSNLK